jgi:putative peptide zinc metalloprotease protein
MTGAISLPIELPALVEPPAPPPLPRLRQELRIEPGAPLANGAPSWTLFDPVRHQFFQLGPVEFRLLTAIAAGDIDPAVIRLRREGMSDEAIGDALTQVVEFAYINLLTVDRIEPGDSHFARHTTLRRKAWWRQLLDNYLFFRVPLIRPAPFLQRTVGRLDWIYSHTTLWFFVLLTIVNLYFVSREWDLFLATIQEFFSWQGLIAYALGLTSVKILHELGHAYTATRYGCRIPSMGVSFLVMFPVLYTDTTGVWKLTSRKQRLAVDCAGVSAELIVASICTTLWLLLPDGTLRSVAFVLATSSWLISLSINLNPFMRFDGYYVLADLINMPNLQPRSFALGRWQLREWLFRLGDAPPEALPPGLRRGMIVYAWLTWAYRFVLFLGIALLVYTMFFKLLGILLFIVEIGVFIVRPIAQEFRTWWNRRTDIGGSIWRRPWLWVLGGGVIFAFLPLDRHIVAPAILAPAGVAPLVPGSPARIERILVQNGQRVAAGTIIAELRRPDAANQIAMQEARILQRREQLARAPGSDEDLANRAILEQELAAAEAALQAVRQQQDRLTLRAPLAGIVTDLGAEMHAGRWLSSSEVVARIVNPDRSDVIAFVSERDATRLQPNGEGRFVADDPALASRPARIAEISTSAISALDISALASRYGGPISVDAGEQARSGDLRPREPQYRVRLITPQRRARSTFVQPVTGYVRISAHSVSLAEHLFIALAKLLRQEASVT